MRCASKTSVCFLISNGRSLRWVSISHDQSRRHRHAAPVWHHTMPIEGGIHIISSLSVSWLSIRDWNFPAQNGRGFRMQAKMPAFVACG